MSAENDFRNLTLAARRGGLVTEERWCSEFAELLDRGYVAQLVKPETIAPGVRAFMVKLVAPGGAAVVTW